MPGDDLAALVDQVVARLEAAQVRGAQRGASDLARKARDTSAYRDVTGATRASTTAYVVGAGDDAAIARARADAAARNPGQEAPAPPVQARPDRITVVLAAFTRYSAYLEATRAGQNAFIGPALLSDTPALLRAIADAVRQELGG